MLLVLMNNVLLYVLLIQLFISSQALTCNFVLIIVGTLYNRYNSGGQIAALVIVIHGSRSYLKKPKILIFFVYIYNKKNVFIMYI